LCSRSEGGSENGREGWMKARVLQYRTPAEQAKVEKEKAAAERKAYFDRILGPPPFTPVAVRGQGT